MKTATAYEKYLTETSQAACEMGFELEGYIEDTYRLIQVDVNVCMFEGTAKEITAFLKGYRLAEIKFH